MPIRRDLEPVAVLGAGAMGAAMATHLVRAGRSASLLATEHDAAAVQAHRRKVPHPGIRSVLPHDLDVVEHGSWAPHLAKAGTLVVAVSGEGVIPTVKRSLDHAGDALWIVATKAWDAKQSKSAARLVADAVGDRDRVVTIAGPSLAAEVADGVSTNVVCAGWSEDAARAAASLLASPTLRLDVSRDVEGVGIAAVVKNVAAIALGLCDGLAGEEGAVLNTKAAVFSMALREMEQVVLAVGGTRDTVLGPAGVGDLFVTCMGGRNGRFGALIGSGMAADGALAAIGSTVEGYGNAPTVTALADAHGLDLPVMRAIAAVLYEDLDPRAAIEGLLSG